MGWAIIHLTIFLYVLTPEGDIRRVPGNQVLGVSFLCFFVSFCAMLVVLVVSERRASACLIMLRAKQGSHWYHFNAFGMARPGIEPTTSRPRSGRSAICAIGTIKTIYKKQSRGMLERIPLDPRSK